ncbi:MAG: hypothetical protein ACE5IH_08060, partial [Thermodesulfobacteriota bacterium]
MQTKRRSQEIEVRSQKEKIACLRRAIFGEIKKQGIDSDDFRDITVPEIIGKRLSRASVRDMGKILTYLKGGYESSRKGIIDEIIDLAKARFGDGFERPLNNLCKRFGISHYKWLDVRHGKALKKRLKEIIKSEK